MLILILKRQPLYGSSNIRPGVGWEARWWTVAAATFQSLVFYCTGSRIPVPTGISTATAMVLATVAIQFLPRSSACCSLVATSAGADIGSTSSTSTATNNSQDFKYDTDCGVLCLEIF
jgi:hypothetical protein